jgi:hypothetical protein
MSFTSRLRSHIGGIVAIGAPIYWGKDGLDDLENEWEEDSCSLHILVNVQDPLNPAPGDSRIIVSGFTRGSTVAGDDMQGLILVLADGRPVWIRVSNWEIAALDESGGWRMLQRRPSPLPKWVPRGISRRNS